jgi:polyvinyl alcohol dehydrogenase (cytochrome)
MKLVVLFLLALLAQPLSAQPAPAGNAKALFDKNCASCHAVETLKDKTPEVIFRTLTIGAMRQQAASLTEANRRSLAEFLSGATLKLAQFADAKAMPNRCTGNPPSTGGAAWNGWGVDSSNTRFQPEKAAGFTAAQAPHLTLKWAFGFPGASSVWGQPAISGGRVFLGIDTGFVYALDAATGCVYWSFEADAGVRTAITIDSNKAFFGDMKASAYAVNATTGVLERLFCGRSGLQPGNKRRTLSVALASEVRLFGARARHLPLLVQFPQRPRNSIRSRKEDCRGRGHRRQRMRRGNMAGQLARQQ